MIQLRTALNVSDNSGVVIARCIRNYKKKTQASIGDRLLCSVFSRKINLKAVKQKVKYTNGDLIFCLVIRVKQLFNRYNVRFISYCYSSVVVVNTKNEPVGSKIKGPVSGELRGKGFLRLLSLASRII